MLLTNNGKELRGCLSPKKSQNATCIPKLSQDALREANSDQRNTHDASGPEILSIQPDPQLSSENNPSNPWILEGNQEACKLQQLELAGGPAAALGNESLARWAWELSKGTAAKGLSHSCVFARNPLLFSIFKGHFLRTDHEC